MLNNIRKTAKLVSNANKFQQQKDKLEKLLATVRVQGTSSNKKVTVTVTGNHDVIDVQIDPSLINFVYENLTSQNKPDTLLGKSVLEAIKNALSSVQEAVVKKMQETNSIDDLLSVFQAASGAEQ